MDGRAYVRTYGRLDGRVGTQKVETVAPTNFQDKGVNNGLGNRWLVFDRCRNDGFQSLADNNAWCRWFINPRIVANLKALSMTVLRTREKKREKRKQDGERVDNEESLIDREEK